ncbi:MAG TPA: GNAT family N-acetyltransferase [Thermoanaerobaculia bacterium]
MIRTGTRADLPRIAALFAKANDAPYDVVRVAEEKCFGAGVSGDAEVRIYGDFAGVSVTCGKALRILAVDREQRRRGIGSALLGEAEARGARIVAAEAGNYFTPGVVSSDTATIEFFTRRRYKEIARTQNLVAEVESGAWEKGVVRATHATRERVLGFIENEFGRIWRFEASHAFENDPATLVYVEADGDIAGFAAHEANNRGLGFFGPTGVARAHRGKGLGARLLRASLADLHRLGYERVIIPWTDAIDFYRKACGAVVSDHFVTLARVIDSAP